MRTRFLDYPVDLPPGTTSQGNGIHTVNQKAIAGDLGSHTRISDGESGVVALMK